METRKKRIGIVSLGYGWLPCEPGPSRFYYIAKIFAEYGYNVDLVGSSFQHFEKKPRNTELIKRQGYPFQCSFIPVPQYRKNIDLRREYSNKKAEKRVIAYLETQKYDLIYCSIPANNIAAAVGKYCNENRIPLIVDIEDLWPEAMEMVFHVPLVKNFLFSFYRKDAEIAYQYADAVIGTSDEYTNRAFKYQRRNIPNKTVYVGCDLSVFDQGVKKYSDEIIKKEDEFWVTYAGSIGASYDIRTLVLAAKQIQDKGYADIQIKILGTGPLKTELEELSKEMGCNNIIFLGYVEYPKMAAYLEKSDVLLNSFVKNAPQSIVNKVGDYLAAGKPMINTLENKEFRRLVCEKDFGRNIEAENAELLAETILHYKKDKNSCQRQGIAARKTAECDFNRENSYLQILKIAEQLLES